MKASQFESPASASKKTKSAGRTTNKLSALGLAKLLPGHHGDGAGLYLQVSEGGTSRTWVFRYTRNGKTREMGLGPLHTYSLAEARARARDCRQQLDAGADPIMARKVARETQKKEAAAKTFDECATRYIELHRAGWKNAKHGDQWQNTLKTYASPVIGTKPVSEVTTAMVLQILERDNLWTLKNETADRVRQRMALVLDWAKVRGYRDGENPARWVGHLDKSLPKPSKVKKVEHHPALPYAQVADFLAALRPRAGIAPRALEFLVLTAARTGEVIGAGWNEIDTEAGIWTIPAARTKTGKEHRVPLVGRTLEILQELAKVKIDDFVFPGGKIGKGLSNAAMMAVVDRMRDAGQEWNNKEGRAVTVHGFRSTFRDWAGEVTTHPREICEAALAHALENKVEAAYQRGDLFEKRRALMQDWEKFCGAQR